MKVVVDTYIPYVAEALSGIADVVCLDPDNITATTVHDADAIIVRTRTKVNESLFKGSHVRFVATATIGFDHIDTDYCRHNGITFVSCPGCNAQAVCDYVEEALRELVLPFHAPDTQTIGVVGVGHVGSRVAKMAQRLGLHIVLSDPPLGINISLDELAQACDIITFHTPLTREGNYPTLHMANTGWLSKTKPDALIINAARGGIVDEQALLDSHRPCVIDCWENEPHINPNLLLSPQTLRASCHIAGYSIEGKQNASQMCLDALSHFFSLPALNINKKAVPLQGDSKMGWLERMTTLLKSHPNDFEIIRKQYKLR